MADRVRENANRLDVVHADCAGIDIGKRDHYVAVASSCLPSWPWAKTAATNSSKFFSGGFGSAILIATAWPTSWRHSATPPAVP